MLCLQIARTAASFRVSQSPIPLEIHPMKPVASLPSVPPAEFACLDSIACRLCKFMIENQNNAATTATATVTGPTGGLLPLPAPTPLSAAYHSDAMPSYTGHSTYGRMDGYDRPPAAYTYPDRDAYASHSGLVYPPPNAVSSYDSYREYDDDRRDRDGRSRASGASGVSAWPSSVPAPSLPRVPPSGRHCIFFHTSKCRHVLVRMNDLKTELVL